MVTRTFTLSQFTEFSKNLPNQMEKMGVDITAALAKDFQRGVRMRAPIGFSGTLKQIEINKKSNRVFQLVGPAHWEVVEKGLKPKAEFLPIEVIEEHINNPGGNVNSKVNFRNPKGWFRTKRPRGKGFVSKSILSTKNRLDEIAGKEVSKALQK